MNKKTITTISLLITVLLLFCSMKLVYAKEKPKVKGGKGEHKGWSEGKRTGQTEKKGKGGAGRHKGWTEGKRAGQKSESSPWWRGKGLKKGWKKSKPPGWKNWNKKTRKEWKKNLLKATKEIKVRANKKGWNTNNQKKMSTALVYSIQRGVPVGHARKVIEACIGHGLTGEETLRISMALSEGVGRGANFETLGSQVVEKLRAGYRGEKLADKIHAMIETRYRAKMKAQEEKVGKPVGREKHKSEKKEKFKKVKKERPEKKDIEKPERGGKKRPEGRGPGGKGRGGRGK